MAKGHKMKTMHPPHPHFFSIERGEEDMSECPECQLRRTDAQGSCSFLLELPSPLGSAFVSLACFRCGEYTLGCGLHHCIIIRAHTENYCCCNAYIPLSFQPKTQ